MRLLQKNNIPGKFVVVFSLFFCAFFCVRAFAAEPSVKDPKILQAIVDAINQKLPMMADSDTRIDYVTAGSNSIIYHVTLIHLKVKDADKKEFMARIGNAIYSSACKNPNYIKFFRDGISIVSDYYDADNVKIGRVLVPPSLCGFENG